MSVDPPEDTQSCNVVSRAFRHRTSNSPESVTSTPLPSRSVVIRFFHHAISVALDTRKRSASRSASSSLPWNHRAERRPRHGAFALALAGQLGPGRTPQLTPLLGRGRIVREEPRLDPDRG